VLAYPDYASGTPLQDIVDWLHKRFPEEKR
jgi:hypothetical protein